MTYLKVEWIHNFEDEPVELFSELDAQRYETRKVEQFRSGTITFMGPDGASGTTMLGEMPVPSVEEINADPEFRAVTIDKQVFERVWRAATISVAA